MENCTCCFTDYLAKCETDIQLNIVLHGEGPYRWVITDKFGNKYQGELTAGETWYTIAVEDLPPGLLTLYSGAFTLQIFPEDQACGPESFIIAGKHNCIEFSITGGTFEKNNLGCELL